LFSPSGFRQRQVHGYQPDAGHGSQCDSLNITIYDTGVKHFLDITGVRQARTLRRPKPLKSGSQSAMSLRIQAPRNRTKASQPW